jgi:hypothetical protein
MVNLEDVVIFLSAGLLQNNAYDEFVLYYGYNGKLKNEYLIHECRKYHS